MGKVACSSLERVIATSVSTFTEESQTLVRPSSQRDFKKVPFAYRDLITYSMIILLLTCCETIPHIVTKCFSFHLLAFVSFVD